MLTNDFNHILEQQIERSTSVLGSKAAEYATEDRLHNFKVAAELQGITPREALRGMMAKHTVSVFDMCKGDNTYSLDMWNEKITDHINYLLLLRAVVEEEIRGGATEIPIHLGVETASSTEVYERTKQAFSTHSQN